MIFFNRKWRFVVWCNFYFHSTCDLLFYLRMLHICKSNNNLLGKHWHRSVKKDIYDIYDSGTIVCEENLHCWTSRKDLSLLMWAFWKCAACAMTIGVKWNGTYIFHNCTPCSQFQLLQWKLFACSILESFLPASLFVNVNPILFFDFFTQSKTT